MQGFFADPRPINHGMLPLGTGALRTAILIRKNIALLSDFLAVKIHLIGVLQVHSIKIVVENAGFEELEVKNTLKIFKE